MSQTKMQLLKKKKRNRWHNEKYSEFRANIESDKIDKPKNNILGDKQMVKSKSSQMISVKFAQSLRKLLLEVNFAKTKNNTIENKFRNSKPWLKYECPISKIKLK